MNAIDLILICGMTFTALFLTYRSGYVQGQNDAYEDALKEVEKIKEGVEL